ncbi:MAG: OmpA family protein [Acidobacteria bacterium]|nr:OmpA family protein [Acidobacteriota bacterium]
MIEEPDDPPAGAPEWMVTFADLMSLLLTFFVLLLSFSNTEVVKFQQMMGSVRDALGLKSELDLSDSPAGHDMMPFENPQAGEGQNDAVGPGQTDPTPQEVREKLQEILKDADLSSKGVALETDDGVVMQLSGDLLFNSGAATINPEARDLLEKLAEYTLSVDYSMDIVGYTDNVPIATAVYPSNWELSAARAGQAVRYMTERGVAPERLRAIGRADTNPLQSNDTPEGRAANRRVEFVLTRLSDAQKKNLLDEKPAAPAGDAQ